LIECLDSVANQSYDNTEIIIVNDGSTDNGLIICEAFIEKHKNAVLVNQENQGLGAARNAGIKIANGEYIIFLDSDDILHIDFCRIMLNAIESSKVLLAACHYKRINENSQLIKSDRIFTDGIIETLSSENLIDRVNLGEQNYGFPSAWGKIYHKSIFQNKENRYPVGVFCEDIWLMMKICIEVKKVCLVSDELVYYRFRTASISNGPLYNYKILLDMIMQITNAVNVLFCSNDIADNIKMDYYDSQCKYIVSKIYNPYIIQIYHALLLTDLIDINQKYVLLGAGVRGSFFRNLLLSPVPSENIVFIDNNEKLHGNKKEGVLVISPKEFKKIYTDHKIIITNPYFFEFLIQFYEEGIIQSIDEILPNNGTTSIEKAMIKGIDYFTETLFPWIKEYRKRINKCNL